VNHRAKASSSASTTPQTSRLGAVLRGAFAKRAVLDRAKGSGAPSHRRAPLALFSALVLTALIALGAATAIADTAPTPVIQAPTEVEFTTAHLKGTVNPNAGPSITHWHFEYSKDPVGEGWSAAPDHELSQSESEESSPLSVSEDLANATLAPATTYFVRLVANNDGGSNESANEELETKAVAKPSVSVDPVSTFTDSSAHFVGHLNPNAAQPEGSTSAAEKAAFETSWHFECVAPGPTCGSLSGTPVPAGNAAVEVKADATGLEPNAAYYVVLLASNAGGTEEAATAATPSFTTGGLAPTVRAFAAGPVQAEAANLNGEVNPHNSPTKYWFEWGTSDCSANPCAALPAGKDADAGSGPFFLYTTQHLTGLSPGTTYHFRLVAENGVDTTEGADQTFTTAAPEASECPNEALRAEMHSTFLPDCRAYEMVSPPEKNGLGVVTQNDKIHVATDGDGVTFATLGGFGDQQGTSFDAEYLARRTAQPATNGWSTQGINPRARGTTYASQAAAINGENIPSFMDAFTPDLSAAIYRSWSPLTEGANTSEVTNFYRIDGLGDPGAAIHLLSDSIAPLPAAWSGPFRNFIISFFVGASTDLGHVAFESPLALTADAPPYEGLCATLAPLPDFFGCPSYLYENAEGTVRLVGRIPSAPDTECDDAGGSPCVAAPSSQAGIGGIWRQYSGRMVSAGGSRILFQAPVGLAASGDGTGDIYLREDGERTYQLNVSESEPSAEPQPATLWDASRDGSRVFFVTPASLLAEDEDGSRDLYMYEVEKPAGERLTLISTGSAGSDAEVSPVVGTSDDGHYVYFVASGQLVSGEPPANSGLYLWHDGDLSYIGRFGDGGDAYRNGPRTQWLFPSSMKRSRLSPDGRHLLFMTTNDNGLKGRGGFTGYDHAGHQELYLFSADSGRLACASCNPSGEPATANALTNVRENAATAPDTSDLSHALSDDGRYVFFSTADRLVEEDTNGVSDAYEYDAANGTVHLLSSGTDDAPSYLIDASNDGANAFFATRQRLSGWDSDGAYDLYDARVGGGLPEPPLVPAACEGESCLPGAGGAPGAAPTASQATGPGNPKQGCPKGKRRVRSRGKVRCLKRAIKHHRKHKRNADNNRRASR
jgi:hypothetical protein